MKITNMKNRMKRLPDVADTSNDLHGKYVASVIPA